MSVFQRRRLTEEGGRPPLKLRHQGNTLVFALGRSRDAKTTKQSNNEEIIKFLKEYKLFELHVCFPATALN